MLFKRRSSRGEKNEVHYINGIVTMGPVSLNVYAFYTDGVLIDTGSPSLLGEFKPFFNEMDIDQVVLTHHHEDHSGGAAYLQREKQLPIRMHELLIGYCKKKASYPFYRKAFWGTRQPFIAEPLGEAFESRRSSWKVIDTPGHASDHVALINEQTGQLFSGDLYVHPKTKLILRNENILQIIHSIRYLLTYDFGEMFCCHAGHVKDGRKALTNKLDYLTSLREEVLYLATKGLSEKEIHKQVFAKRYPITFFSLGEWDSKHIVRSILQTGIKRR